MDVTHATYSNEFDRLDGGGGRQVRSLPKQPSGQRGGGGSSAAGRGKKLRSLRWFVRSVVRPYMRNESWPRKEKEGTGERERPKRM